MIFQNDMWSFISYARYMISDNKEMPVILNAGQANQKLIEMLFKNTQVSISGTTWFPSPKTKKKSEKSKQNRLYRY